METIKTIGDITVMYIEAETENIKETSGKTFAELEKHLPELKGRKFYGTLYDDKYRACVALNDKDDPQKLGLLVDKIPGGKYATIKIADWEKHLDEIGPTFEELSEKYIEDKGRPQVEFYRSRKELIIMLPVK